MSQHSSTHTNTFSPRYRRLQINSVNDALVNLTSAIEVQAGPTTVPYALSGALISIKALQAEALKMTANVEERKKPLQRYVAYE